MCKNFTVFTAVLPDIWYSFILYIRSEILIGDEICSKSQSALICVMLNFSVNARLLRGVKAVWTVLGRINYFPTARLFLRPSQISP